MNKYLNKKWKRREVLLFLEQFSLYISSGLSLDTSLSIMARHNKKRQTQLMEMKASIEKGVSFSKVFALRAPDLKAVLAIIEQGESSGEFALSLRTAKELLERSDELRKKCLSALMYPLVIAVFSILITLGLVRGVMPQIIPLLLSLHVQLPILTRIVISTSSIITSYGFVIMAGLVLLYIGANQLYRKNSHCRGFVHRVILLTPLIGELVRLYWVALFLRSYGSLLSSGVASPRAYSGAVAGISLIPFHLYLSSKSSRVFDGARLSELFDLQTFKVPPYIPALISAGEASGHLADSLIRAADLVDKDLSDVLKKLTSLIEPVMMAGMGCVVGAIALSIMMPIYDISKVLQR